MDTFSMITCSSRKKFNEKENNIDEIYFDPKCLMKNETDMNS